MLTFLCDWRTLCLALQCRATPANKNRLMIPLLPKSNCLPVRVVTSGPKSLLGLISPESVTMHSNTV